ARTRTSTRSSRARPRPRTPPPDLHHPAIPRCTTRGVRTPGRNRKDEHMSVNLSKGQKVSLEKPSGGTLTRVRMGLGWDAVKKRGFFGKKEQEIDLDASGLLFDATGRLVDQVWFNQLQSKDGSVLHTGDNRTGAGDG